MALINANPRLDAGDSINRGLEFWYPINEPTGDFLRDISPQQRHARQSVGGAGQYARPVTPIGRTLQQIGGAYKYFSVDGYSWPADSTISASWWQYVPTGQQLGVFYFQGINAISADFPYGTDIFWCYGTEAGRLTLSYSSFFDKWVHFVATSDRARRSCVYANGVLFGSGTVGGSLPSSYTPLQIGLASTSAHISNLRVWRNRIITPGEAARLYREPWAGTLPGNLRSRRTFRSSGGTTYNDTIADAVTGAESFATRLVAVGTISDAATAAESNATAMTMRSALSDAVTAAEASAASQVMPNPITDDVIGGEAFGTTAVFNSALSDGATASDSVEGSVSTTYNEAIADDVTASDTMEGELPNTGDTHDGFKRRTRRQRALDAAERQRREDMATEARALRLSLEAAMGMAAEAAEEAPPQAAEALQEATEAARVVPAVLARQVDWVALQAARDAVTALHTAIEAAARAKALADDDEDVEILLRAL